MTHPSYGPVRIMMLHRVMHSVDAAFGLPTCYRIRGTALTTGEFMAFLDDLPRVLPLRTLETRVGASWPGPGVILTFDDGYREHAELVGPLLAARGLTASFYVSTGLHADATEVGVVDAWYWLLDHAQARIARVILPDGETHIAPVDTLESKSRWVAGPPKEALLGAPAAVQRMMLETLAASLNVVLPAALASSLYMGRDEWQVLLRLGMRLGAHGVSHVRLSQLDRTTLCSEVHESIAEIRGLTGEAPPFCYPDGSYNNAVIDVVSEAGASSAVTCDPGPCHDSVSRLRLPRYFVQPATLGASLLASLRD